MINFFFPYFGPLLVKVTLTKEQLKKLTKICNKKTSNHKKLAGHFKDEYLLNTENYEKIIIPQLDIYKKLYKNFYNKELVFIETKEAWVNYMKAGDFNPPHIHPGSRFSSVLFLKVPKKLQEEIEQFEGADKKYNGPGFLSFRYGEYQPRDVLNLYSTMPKEGDMFIFPSFLSHMVFPFKSKNIERISIAANYI
tara:strand:- start:1049 stop:1630 length:582 start_codon:yes stop_codon:yes gene_type:complete